MDAQSTIEKRKILCRRDDAVSEGVIERRDLPANERVARGAKVGGALWAVGFLTVFIPVLHFVLPPLFLILGLVFGWAAWHDRAEVLGGEFACPSCKTINRMAKQGESFPKSIRCEHCHLTLELSLG